MILPLTLLACFSVSQFEFPLPDRSIALDAKDHHGGGLFDVFTSLKISDGDHKTWRYTCDNRSYYDAHWSRTGNVGIIEGSYELLNDLAIFTDASDTRRFAFNFDTRGGDVQFNRFFPWGDETLRHHGKSYRKTAKGWQPALEFDLSMSRRLPRNEPGEPDDRLGPAAVWEIAFNGQRTRWDEGGKKSVEAIDISLTYKRQRSEHFFETKQTPADWAPKRLFPEIVDGRLVSVSDWGGVSLYELRGFHPAGHGPLPAK